MKKVPSFDQNSSTKYEHSPNKPETSKNSGVLKPYDDQNEVAQEDDQNEEEIQLQEVSEQ